MDELYDQLVFFFNIPINGLYKYLITFKHKNLSVCFDKTL